MEGKAGRGECGFPAEAGGANGWLPYQANRFSGFFLIRTGAENIKKRKKERKKKA